MLFGPNSFGTVCSNMLSSTQKFVISGRQVCSLLLLSLIVALLVAACGEVATPVSLQLATAAPTPSEPPESTETQSPTATPGIFNTATPSAQPTATTAPTDTPTPGPTTRSRPTPRPAIQLAENGTPAAIAADVELKVIKAAYDALVKHYYMEPDTSKIAQKALEQSAASLGVTPPTNLNWLDATPNWVLFEAEFRKLVAAGNTNGKLLPPRVLAHTVVIAMAQTVGDLHTYYLDELRTDAWDRTSRGDNSNLGFGVTFTSLQNAYYVLRIVSGSPAQQAGFKVGDKLKTFDGKELNQSNFVQLSRVQEGRVYEFVFERAGTPLTLKVEAKRYRVPTAEWKLLDNNKIGYILLNAFHTDVEKKLDEAIADLRKQGAESLIIDLRTNGGGYNFDKVAGRFIKNGEPLGRFINRGKPEPLRATSENKYLDPPMPLVLLIDKGSASASEVFSLAVQDYKVGTLIGSKTAGAIGTVRAWPLSDGTSLAVTASIYENFKGQRLNGVGVTPDIIVARTPADILAGRDPQLDTATKFLAEKAKTQP